MDNLLKGYAQKRRDDASQLELDLATRNMLQAEVARKLGKVPVAAPARPRFAWWPQLIIGVSCAAALTIAILVWKLPPENRLQDFENTAKTRSLESQSDREPAAHRAKEVAKSKDDKGASPEVSYDKTPHLSEATPSGSVSERRLDSGGILAKKAEAPAAPETGATNSLALSSPLASTAPTSTGGQLVAGAASSLAIKEEPSTTANPRNADLAQQQRIQFSQINNRAQYRDNFNSPPLPKVLTNFGLELSGSNVVVVDSDGAVYSGKVTANAPQSAARQTTFALSTGATRATKSAALNDDRKSTNDVDFRVSGYNNRLRAKVVFTGSLSQNNMSATNAPSLGGSQNSVVPSQAGEPQQALQQNAQQNLFLNGRVQVGRNTEFQIQAAPAK